MLGRIIRIDADGEAGVELLQEWSGGDLPPTWMFTSPGSITPQQLYSWPEDVPIGATVSKSLKGEHVELKLMGLGLQTVIPPSLHPDGGAYAWLGGYSPDDLPLAVAPEWLVKRMAQKGKEKTAHPGKSGSREAPDALDDLKVAKDIRELIRSGKPPEGKSRSEALWKVYLALIEAGYSKDAIADVVCDPDNGISAKPLEHGDPRAWVFEEVGRVLKKRRDNGPEYTDEDVQQSDTRPIIHIGTNIRAMIEKCTSAILGLPGEPILYQRARQLAMLSFDPPPLKKVTRPPGVPSIVIPSNAYLRTLASDSANWERFDERKKRWVKTQPWTGIGPYLQSHDRWPFPQLHGVITAPTLRSDGSILESPGYDPETGLYLATTRHFPQVPEHPDYDDAKQAIARLQEPFEQFAFDGNYGLSAVLAGILTIAVRYLIDDPVPLFAISATKAGTGKSLLADTIALAATGSLPARYTPTHDPEEERKRLFALALAGTPIILIDNVIEPLGSPALDMVLTSTTLTDRVLGASEQRTISFMSTMLATGNGMQYKGDTARRALPIDLDAMMENPEQRTGFNHENLREYVKEHHPQLVVDALTIVKSYIDVGQPKQDGLPIIGSFEKWDRLIRHCLVWLGCEDPAGGRERAMLEQDVVRGPLLALLTAWHDCYGDHAKTLKIVEQDIYYHRKRPLTTDQPDRYSEHENPISPEERGKWDDLLAALSEFDDRSNGTSISTKTIGYELRKMQGRVVDSLRLTKDRTDGHSKSVRWKVINVSES